LPLAHAVTSRLHARMLPTTGVRRCGMDRRCGRGFVHGTSCPHRVPLENRISGADLQLQAEVSLGIS
jgi:hypothetical protein